MRPRPSVKKLQEIFVGRLLVPRLSNALNQEYDRALAAFGLTKQQASILGSCDIGEARTTADLAKIYGLEASSIVRAVERLEKKGFLTRSRSAKDRRQVCLQITAKGQAQLWAAVPEAMKVAQRAWQGVTKSELAALQSIVNKVLGNLEQTSVPLTTTRKRSAVVV